jgi:hypothetical protein
MPRYIVECESGFCGVNDTVLVEADDEMEADKIANEWWQDQVAASVSVQNELKSNDDDDGYEQIN